MADEEVVASEESGEQESSAEDTETLRGLTDEELESVVKEDEPGEVEPEQAAQEAPTPQTPRPPKAEEPQEATPQEQRTVSRDEHEAVLRQLEQAKLWAARRSNEIGELRKQLRTHNERLQQNLQQAEEDPNVGRLQLRQMERQIEKNEEHLAQLEAEESTTHKVLESQQLFASYVNPADVSVNDMCESLLRDGIDPGFVQQFKANPFGSAHGETLVHLAKRAHAEKLVIRAAGYIKELRAELEQSRKKPAQVLEGVNRALKQKPTVTAASGKSSGKAALSNTNLRSMSDAELEEILQNS